MFFRYLHMFNKHDHYYVNAQFPSKFNTSYKGRITLTLAKMDCFCRAIIRKDD